MSYLVLDIETIPDLTIWNPSDAKKKEDGKEPFAPVWAQRPIVIGCVWLDNSYVVKRANCIDSKSNTIEAEREILVAWNQFMGREKPTIVSWYGRGFDLPTLTMRSLRWGIPMPWYFSQNYRYRYSEDHHADLCDVMSDFGSAGRGLKLDSIARLIGCPGKGEVDGSSVNQMWQEGRISEISTYCLTDVAQTTWVFLRWQYLKGKLSLDSYRFATSELLSHLNASIEERPDLKKFLSEIDRKRLLLEEP
jgi:hypothetical protein